MKNFTTSLLLALLLCSASTYSLPKLNSFASATATIYLDFDGQTVSSSVWNDGSTLFCTSPGLTDAQITEIFNRVSEDYRPFNINITTDSTKFLAAPLTQRMRVIITPTSSWKPNVGGVSFVGSFTWGDDTPAFVFSDKLGPNSPKYIAECCTHESGHTVGLSHQSSYDNNCVLTETYNTGVGSGETGWAPVMGNSYYKNMTGWNDGPTPYGCALVQDNLTIITSQNGFTYRNDDYTETMNNNTYSLGTNSFSLDGLITTTTDKDAFKFVVSQNGQFHMDASPYNVGGNNIGANLDIKAMLYNSSQVLVATYDPAGKMNVTIDTTLDAGTYYIVLDGTGNANTSNYGSLGSYKITGFVGALAIHSITLTGNTNKEKHNLNWNVVADDVIKFQDVEYSTDGRRFQLLTSADPLATSFSYIPSNISTLYYRIKVTSTLNEIAYSNIISLKGLGRGGILAVSSFVHDRITVNALSDYQYHLLDANGKLVATGTGKAGSGDINIYNRPSGLYIIQLYSNNQIQTERIIKQ